MCLYLSGPFAEIGMQKKLSYMFNIGLITPRILVYPMVFPHFMSFITFHEYANEIAPLRRGGI